MPLDSLLAPGTATSYEARLDTLRLEGWDPKALREGRVLIETAMLSGLMVHVYSDRRLAGPATPKALPQNRFRSLPFDVRIEEAHLQGSTIRYEEVARDGTRPGVVDFGRLRADLGPIDNRQADIMVMRSWTTINEALPLAVELSWPLHREGLDLAVHAWTSAFPVTALNPMFEPNAGIRVRSGRVDTLETRFDVVQGRATGMLDAVYRELEVERRDKNDPSDRHVVASWILDMKIREERSALGGEEPGRIEHHRDRTESIFYVILVTVRSGLISRVSG